MDKGLSGNKNKWESMKSEKRDRRLRVVGSGVRG